jgi:CYTH domain-containing protein/DNA-binding XRE family transcriptional regulator/thymidylate kinase
MKDYQFGEKIYKLRKQSGFSQNQLGELLGLSGKTISKWENGGAKPQLDTMKKLSKIFGVSVDELLCMDEAAKSVTKIVITGGPCAGKTTALSHIQNFFTKMGYYVIIVPETATELIMGGVTPWGLNTNLDYQLCQMTLQLEKEKVFLQAAQKVFGKDKILVVCDRGTMDNKAYMNDAEFSWVLSSMGTSYTEIRDRYDAVFHLVTAAKGAQEFYTTANNEARTETIEEASLLDDKIIAAWMGHPHLRVIDNSSDFKGKLDKLIKEITAFLGEPEPYEIERKFLIQYPDLKALEANYDCRKIDIIQTYLRSHENEEVRVRQRGEDGHYIYLKTVKKRISGMKRIETETRISKDEYLSLLMEADTSKRQIRKTRYCLMYQNQYFEIDIYPFWSDQAIMEIELSNENDEIKFPKNIKIIKEVTEDDFYKNASLAEKIIF